MSTRAIYYFKDEHHCYKVYKHWDNYPDGAYHFIKKALALAWLLPRFEADEFACAFIAANKEYAGNIRLIPDDVTDMGQDYEYTISMKERELNIEFSDEDENGNKIKFNGTLEEMKNYVNKNKETH